ncbi:MAG: YbaB/EbfC family nucleoid-associated protein [Alphaproteobacteria bacterium]|nr:YbaB/EbfC family nucleoid-associated protein [Alphaproteobacteria bacterium]
MTNIMQMLKQAQDMQGKMAVMQEKLAQTEVSGMAGDQLVQVVMTGKGEVRKLKIAPVLVDPTAIDMLEDMIITALRDARAKADALIAGETEKAMGGIKLPPGVKLPF